MDLVSRVPRQSEEAEFLLAHRATSPSVRHFLNYYEEGMSFRRYLEVLAEQERDENLPAHHVPSTFLFAFAGTRIVGRVSIRHSLIHTPSVLVATLATPWSRSTGGKAMPPRSSGNRSRLHVRSLA